MNAFAFAAAYLADLIFGDPAGYPHPVRLIGKAVLFLEKRLLSPADSPGRQRLLGGFLALSIVFGSGLVTWAIVRVADWMHPMISFMATIFLSYTTLATRNLYDEVSKVTKSLERRDLSQARKKVGFLVSRDTDHLDEKDVCRALIETVSENASDGVIAPLFYLTLGGPPMAMAYKALNTLDSMVGYRNDRYRFFGWASARADDLANFIPARLTALLFMLASFILGKNWRGSWRVARRDGRKNPSPNSGVPEAAVAGALDIQLGGENFYFGRCEIKPRIGDAKTPIDLDKVKASLRLMIAASLIAALMAMLIMHFTP